MQQDYYDSLRLAAKKRSTGGFWADADVSVLWRAGVWPACSHTCLQHGLCCHPSNKEHAENAVASPVSNSHENETRRGGR